MFKWIGVQFFCDQSDENMTKIARFIWLPQKYTHKDIQCSK